MLSVGHQTCRKPHPQVCNKAQGDPVSLLCPHEPHPLLPRTVSLLPSTVLVHTALGAPTDIILLGFIRALEHLELS